MTGPARHTLSKAVARDHVHSREIRCRGFRRQDGLWDLEASLVDTKTHSFSNVDRDGVAAGEPVHWMEVRLTVDDHLVIRAAEAVTLAGPFAVCGNITPVFATLVGLRIGPGWPGAVLERLRGTLGCTHLTELLLGPLTTTAIQTVKAARARRETATDQRPPPLIDSCYALRGDGPVVQRQWPAFYTGKA